jgi:excisionase family DNA binding protein
MCSDDSEKSPRRKRFLKIPSVAEELDCSERKVWREIESGNLKAHYFGGATRVSSDDLEDYIRRARDMPDLDKDDSKDARKKSKEPKRDENDES